VLTQADLVLATGSLLAFGARLLRAPLRGRIRPVDLVEQLCVRVVRGMDGGCRVRRPPRPRAHRL
jgi:UDP-N-acetyl-D-mannosaminuronic acid transferase (WecB/TagA/CpsF family)